MIPKRPYVSPPYARGAAVGDSDALAAWLSTQTNLVRVPVVVQRGATGLSGRGARIGALEVDIDDTALGISLADRCRQLAPAGDTCAVWLEGRWRGERDGRFVLAVVHVGEPIVDLASATHAEGQVERS